MDKAEQLQELRVDLAEALTHWPSSAKLMELVTKLDARSHSIGAQLQMNGSDALNRARNEPTARDRLRVTQEALRYLDAAAEIVSEDANVEALRIQAATEEKRAKNAIILLDEADKYMSLRDEVSLNAARNNLGTIADDFSDYVQVPRYRSLLTKLQRYLLEEVEIELDSKSPDLSRARTMMAAVMNPPFNILGRSQDAERLHERVEAKLGWRKRAPFLIGGGVVIILIIFAALFGNRIVASTLSPTETPTATFTLTPTATTTTTPTPTATPTATPSPTPTAEAPLCIGVTKSSSYAAYYVYDDPDLGSDQIGTVSTQQRRVEVWDQTRDKGGALWYKIDYGDQDTTQIGWILADRIVDVTECPDLN
jgi:hypothetical protein